MQIIIGTKQLSSQSEVYKNKERHEYCRFYACFLHYLTEIE